MSRIPNSRSLLLAAAIAAASVLTACGADLETESDPAADLESESLGVTARYPAGTRLRLWRDSPLREGPGTEYPIRRRLEKGNVVRTVTGEGPRGRYYEVSHDGRRGWVYGGDLHSTLPTMRWGLHPDASDALRQLGVPEWRIWQTIGNAAASAGTHARDGHYGGEPYCAAVDLNGAGWSDAEKRSFLHRAAKLGFAGWWRKPGSDGWPSDEIAHFHIIYVGVPMKDALRSQVRDWLENDTGLAYSTNYDFVTWTAAERETVRRLFLRQPPPGDPQDDDRDGIWNISDNCRQVDNPGQRDTDGDGRGDACDSDDDNDGVRDGSDNCPTDRNAEQPDADLDGRGNACDGDDDNDGVRDDSDNCRLVPNAGQADADRDGKGDACESDNDDDGISDVRDNCPSTPNDSQRDTDRDGRGDACDLDDDADGVPDTNDNCPVTPNPDQANTDGGARGDACDDDNDGDGVLDVDDNCPVNANAKQDDRDGDGLGDACDPDIDGDAVVNESDNCPRVSNADQADLDADGVGNPCDDDLDNDGVTDPDDNCLYVANPGQADADADGVGDACE